MLLLHSLSSCRSSSIRNWRKKNATPDDPGDGMAENNEAGGGAYPDRKLEPG